MAMRSLPVERSRPTLSSLPATMASTEIVNLLLQARRPRILVVGDVMLDRYLWGDVDRVSPEAPIPVLKVVESEERLGGAGGVVAILAALETDVRLATALAEDLEGRKVRELADQYGAIAECSLVAADRSTTVKERLLGRTQSRHPQQILRVDWEMARPIGEALTDELLQAIGRQLEQVDAVLISDYGKGVCGGRLVPELAAMARTARVRLIADPAREADFERYRGCTCVTPNRTEAGAALGRTIRTPQEGVDAAHELLRFELEAAIVTMDRDGIAWADATGRSRHFPVQPRQVYDITGAGDMVLGVLGYSLASGADWPTAIELSNLAGGLEIQRLGAAPLSRRELLAELSRGSFPSGEKIIAPDALDDHLRRRRRAGERVVMTNGCFDLLHPGHVASLEYARRQGDCLVVGLNSDRSVEALKGAGRPIIDQQGRAELLASLGCVDYVVLFDEASVAGLVERVRPDVLVKAAEYGREEVVGFDVVELCPTERSWAPDFLAAKLIYKLLSYKFRG